MAKACRNIFNLPETVAPNAMPLDSATWRRTVTVISRKMMMATTDQWIMVSQNSDRLKMVGLPIMAKQMNAPQTSILSARGSIILPSLLVTLK